MGLNGDGLRICAAVFDLVYCRRGCRPPIEKNLIIYSDGAIALTTLALAIMFPFITNDAGILSAVLIVSAIRSVGAGFQMPAVSAVLPQLVANDKLMRVNGINSTIQSVVQFAAPAVAGAVLSICPLSAALYIDIATAAVGIGLLSLIMIPKPERSKEQISVFADMKSGAAYTFKHKFLGKLLIFYGCFIFLCVPSGFLASLFVTRTFGANYVNLTAVELVGFAGMAAGGILMSVWGGFKNRMKTLLIGYLSFGALAVVMGVATNLIVYLAMMFVYGIALTMVQTATTTLIQEKADPAMQGRVFGFLGAFYSGFLPLGEVVFGPMCDVVPIRAVMIFSGVAFGVLSLLLLFFKSFYKSGFAEAKAETAEASNPS